MHKNSELSLQELQEYMDISPFHRHFELDVVEANREYNILKLRLKYSDSYERMRGTKQYHGGVIATLIDISGNFALINLLSYGVPTIDFRVDYLRPAIDTDLTATARIRKTGKKIGIVDIDIEDDSSRLVALGRGCYATNRG